MTNKHLLFADAVAPYRVQQPLSGAKLRTSVLSGRTLAMIFSESKDIPQRRSIFIKLEPNLLDCTRRRTADQRALPLPKKAHSMIAIASWFS
eukprot:CAMPEP_0172867722 /NCGR_PEP_ID=MMETSP1075-20121228/84362_1 /TAXON_ID=2916 /ORGANISM="Ceratium fusus, Strain PA161109" /LENGTH=91 /DNA_ID=CAMNT_0013717153 /DNA_START=10 /DNA_END=282 /DNA_ORIENTATION=-